MGVNSWSKEYAPTGANSLLQEKTSFWMDSIIQRSTQEVTIANVYIKSMVPISLCTEIIIFGLNYKFSW